MSVGGNLSIVGSKLDGLDLTGSTIKGELRLFEEKAGQIIGSWPVLVNQYSGPIFWGMELLSCLLPDSTSLHPVSWHLDPHLDPDQATAALSLISQQPAPECPLCHVAARRLHSRYERADLPWAGWTVRLELGVRKLFCDNPDCGRRIFTERLPGVVAPLGTPDAAARQAPHHRRPRRFRRRPAQPGPRHRATRCRGCSGRPPCRFAQPRRSWASMTGHFVRATPTAPC